VRVRVESHGLVHGQSSTGKTYSVSKVAGLFPAGQVIRATTMSPKALYPLGGIAHKFVIAGERSRAQDELSEEQIDSDGTILRLLSPTPQGRELVRAIRQTRECLSCS
jgi:hypothetical protein